MSRNDDERSRYRSRDDRIRARNLRDPYESQRQVRTYEDEDDAEPRGQAMHPRRDPAGAREPPWDERPARYGGGYREDEPGSRGGRGDARYDVDVRAGRHLVEGYQNEDDRHRAHGYGRHAGPWRNEPGDGRLAYGQGTGGYDAGRTYGQGSRQDDARSDLGRASWTQEHDYDGPPYGARRGPAVRGDSHDASGFRQQGKRYRFDEGDPRGRFRGTQPRGYQRSDDRLLELACERLTVADIDASDIEVKVSQGMVTLAGSVPVRWMKHAAEDLIDDLGGVRDIDNRLRVARGAPGGAQASPGTTAAPSPGAGGTPTPDAADIGGHGRH